jgi:hypothetical protein
MLVRQENAFVVTPDVLRTVRQISVLAQQQVPQVAVTAQTLRKQFEF